MCIRDSLITKLQRIHCDDSRSFEHPAPHTPRVKHVKFDIEIQEINELEVNDDHYDDIDEYIFVQSYSEEIRSRIDTQGEGVSGSVNVLDVKMVLLVESSSAEFAEYLIESVGMDFYQDPDVQSNLDPGLDRDDIVDCTVLKLSLIHI